jgi:hypothetical protein
VIFIDNHHLQRMTIWGANMSFLVKLALAVISGVVVTEVATQAMQLVH